MATSRRAWKLEGLEVQSSVGKVLGGDGGALFPGVEDLDPIRS
jgi:hypothetical protein